MFAAASRKFLTAALVAGTLAAGAVVTAAPALAGPHIHHGGHGGWHGGHGGWHGHRGWRHGRWIGPVALGVGVLGAAAAYDYGVRRCFLERRFDDYGNYLGRVRVCRTVAY